MSPPHVAYPQIEAETLTSPSKSDVQNENCITEKQGKEFIETLLNKEFYIIPRDSGITFDKREFKIAVVQPHNPQKREELFEIMSSNGFKKANTGTLGPLFFKTQLRSDKHEK